MKATLSFDMYEEKEAFNDAVNGGKYKAALEEIWQQVFRPAFKHGYSKAGLTELSDRDYEVIEKLSEIYQEVMKEYVHNDY